MADLEILGSRTYNKKDSIYRSASNLYRKPADLEGVVHLEKVPLEYVYKSTSININLSWDGTPLRHKVEVT